MRVFLRIVLIFLGLIIDVPSVFAFDNDFEINDIELDEENFLDIKAHGYRKSLEYEWFDNTSGWRINIASLDSDLAFVQTELKLQNELSEYVDIRLDVKQTLSRMFTMLTKNSPYQLQKLCFIHGQEILVSHYSVHPLKYRKYKHPF